MPTPTPEAIRRRLAAGRKRQSAPATAYNPGQAQPHLDQTQIGKGQGTGGQINIKPPNFIPPRPKPGESTTNRRR